jgi:hypothetical protein
MLSTHLRRAIRDDSPARDTFVEYVIGKPECHDSIDVDISCEVGEQFVHLFIPQFWSILHGADNRIPADRIFYDLRLPPSCPSRSQQDCVAFDLNVERIACSQP